MRTQFQPDGVKHGNTDNEREATTIAATSATETTTYNIKQNQNIILAKIISKTLIFKKCNSKSGR